MPFAMLLQILKFYEESAVFRFLLATRELKQNNGMRQTIVATQTQASSKA